MPPENDESAESASDPKEAHTRMIQESYAREDAAIAKAQAAFRATDPAKPAAPKVAPEVLEARAQLAAVTRERAENAIARTLTERGVDPAHHAKVIKYALGTAKEFEIDRDGDLYLVDDDGQKHYTAATVVDRMLEDFPRLWSQPAQPAAKGPGGKPLHECTPTELMIAGRKRPEPKPLPQVDRQRLMRGRQLHELSAEELMTLARRQ